MENPTEKASAMPPKASAPIQTSSQRPASPPLLPEEQLRQAYLQALLREREGEIRRQTLERVRVITRAMAPEEEKAYLASRAFQNALAQTRKKDRVSKVLSGGEWPPDYQAEYEGLRPLIGAELRAGRSIDLAFLRSVRRLRLPLKKAHSALRFLAEGVPESFFRKNAGQLFRLSLNQLHRMVHDLSQTVHLLPVFSNDIRCLDIFRQIYKV